jgi:hypothetical protein
MADSCEQGNEPSGVTKGQFFDQLSVLLSSHVFCFLELVQSKHNKLNNAQRSRNRVNNVPVCNILAQIRKSELMSMPETTPQAAGYT